MPPCDQTGVPGDVAFCHFHSSTISGSALWMISRTFASIFPRQSPSSLIFWSIDAEADSVGTDLVMYSSNSMSPRLLDREGFAQRPDPIATVPRRQAQQTEEHLRRDERVASGGVAIVGDDAEHVAQAVERELP